MENQTQKKLELATPKEGVVYFYSNHVRIGYTVSDLKILFGEITDVTPDKYTVTERTQITMTWLQAKVLSEFLSNHIAAYEKHNGPIKTSFVSPFSIPPITIPIVTLPNE